MSTRKLILWAVACGLAILIAGGAFLVRTASHRDELTVTNALVGQSRTVGLADVTVQSWDRTTTQIVAVVSVSLKPTAKELPAASPWSMLVGAKLVAQRPEVLAAGQQACDATVLKPGTTTSCVLAFAVAEGSPFLAFGLDGAQQQWRLAR